MSYKIRYSPQSQRDMDQVWEEVYAASKSYDVADKYVNEFIEHIEGPKMFPCSGIPLKYYGLFTGFYFVNFKKYNAFYRVKGNYIEVARIIFAKADYQKILFKD